MRKFRIPYPWLLLAPYLCFGLGFALNAIAMSANHAQMPVLWPGGCSNFTTYEEDPLHSCMVASTHIKFLCDWIVIKGLGIASIGDMFLWASDYLFGFSLFVWIGLVIRDGGVDTRR